ncbi:hypothetical protein DPMN_191746 [Dreissena polymorpha]|uniref:Uncharacterized protein n=1 Tax=Dreissena polymorpha TaxID=45954 RepID=A0A9D3XVQ7_DREPO|nr:hypothetical protein DPMN_191746 [Dreissena polymorpha]
MFFTDLKHFSNSCGGDINIKTNVLTKFHDDWEKIVTSNVFTRKTAPPIGGHVFQRTGTTFKLNQHIIETNILTNFKLDRGIIGKNLLTKIMKIGKKWAFRAFTMKTAPHTGGHLFTSSNKKCGLWSVYKQMWTDGQTDDGQDRSQKIT